MFRQYQYDHGNVNKDGMAYCKALLNISEWNILVMEFTKKI